MSNKTPNNVFKSIVESVPYWLGYQFKIGREKLIHEASLRYPIADTITAEGISIERIVLEKLHPIFLSKKIDLAIYKNNTDKSEILTNDGLIDKIFEFKLAKKETSLIFKSEHQRVFDDVIRLAYYNMWEKKECYFIMCGSFSDFKNYFIGQIEEVVYNEDGKNKIRQRLISDQEDDTWKSKNSLYKDWFGFNFGETKSIEFKRDGEWGLCNFQKNYHIRDEFNYHYEDNITITTECMAITPYHIAKYRTHSVGIWKIEGTIK
jgi:hypothetical protein